MADKKPQTMEDLLALMGDSITIPQKGQVVKGVITQVGKKTLRVDIGAKTEGLVVDKEFDMAKDYIGALEEGQDIEAVVISAESAQGQVLLSLKKAATDAKWDFFTKAMEADEVLEAKGDTVEFIAKYKSEGKVLEHHETAEFKKDPKSGRWLFTNRWFLSVG